MLPRAFGILGLAEEDGQNRREEDRHSKIRVARGSGPWLGGGMFGQPVKGRRNLIELRGRKKVEEARSEANGFRV